MARKAPRRYKSGPKKGQFMPKAAKRTAAKRTTTKRRKRSAAPTKRRRTTRRRRNPGKVDAKGTILAAAGGAIVGGANYALDGVEKITNTQQAWGVAAGGLVLGLLASMASKPLGMGIAGGALALGGYKLAGIYVAKPATTNGEQMSAIAAGLGHHNMAGRYNYPQMSATQAELSAVEAQMSAVQADLGAVEADLGAVFADYELG